MVHTRPENTGGPALWSSSPKRRAGQSSPRTRLVEPLAPGSRGGSGPLSGVGRRSGLARPPAESCADVTRADTSPRPLTAGVR